MEGAGPLSLHGVEHSPATVRKYMVKKPSTPRDSQTWSTFIKNHAKVIWACDFLVVYTIGFRLMYVFVIIELESRKVVHFNVTEHPTLEWIKQQIRNVCFEEVPRFLLHDNDAKYGQVGQRKTVHQVHSGIEKQIRCRSAFDGWLGLVMGIEGLPIPYGAPNANAFCERFLGTLRRECLDKMIIFNERHLRQVLTEYISWFNGGRVHQGLQGIPVPDPEIASRPEPDKGKLVAFPVLGGLHHDYRMVA